MHPLNRVAIQSLDAHRLGRNMPIDVAIGAQVPAVNIPQPLLVTFLAVLAITINQQPLVSTSRFSKELGRQF